MNIVLTGIASTVYVTLYLVNFQKLGCKTNADSTQQYTVDVERFAGLSIHSFNLIEVFAEIFTCCLGQKCLLVSINKERCLYSRKNFPNTLETVKV